MITEKWRPYLYIYFFLVYLVGAIGLSFFSEWFYPLTPFNLISSAILVLLCQKGFDRIMWLYILAVGVFAWFIEGVGVSTGLIFGHYTYGETLGFKIWNVPILIGLNWVMLVYNAQQFIVYYVQETKPVIVNLLVATSLVMLDILMEFVAPVVDFWSFNDGFAPLQNFVGWWIVGYILSALSLKVFTRYTNFISPYFFFLQWLFFAALTVLSRLD
jgi:putative membrane protein